MILQWLFVHRCERQAVYKVDDKETTNVLAVAFTAS